MMRAHVYFSWARLSISVLMFRYHRLDLHDIVMGRWPLIKLIIAIVIVIGEFLQQIP